MPAKLPLTLDIRADHPANKTGLIVQKGHHYRLEAVHGLDRWTDLWMTTDIKGAPSSAYGFSSWIMHFYEGYRLVPDADWLQLCARIGNGKPQALALPNFEAWASGELTLFANDLPGSYFNNFGAATLVISAIHTKAA